MANAPTSGERLPGFPPNNVNNFPSFAVGYPASAILDLDIVGQDVRLQIVTAEGPRYRLETATSLDPNEQWNPVGSVGEFTGTGGTVSVTHPGGATQQQRFYRVVEVSGGQ